MIVDSEGGRVTATPKRIASPIERTRVGLSRCLLDASRDREIVNSRSIKGSRRAGGTICSRRKERLIRSRVPSALHESRESSRVLPRDLALRSLFLSAVFVGIYKTRFESRLALDLKASLNYSITHAQSAQAWPSSWRTSRIRSIGWIVPPGDLSRDRAPRKLDEMSAFRKAKKQTISHPRRVPISRRCTFQRRADNRRGRAIKNVTDRPLSSM